ncbi:MAG: radical SAM family heme chaperone HemW [Oscillospiraceae bacterium]
MSDAGLYLHVPFCLRKCPYCDFYSGAFSPDAAQAYTDAAVRNLGAYGAQLSQRAFDTIYFGGGTPSLLSFSQVEQILAAAYAHLRVRSPEITLEVNPAAHAPNQLLALRTIGVNRLSIGVQSFDTAELALLGRLHDAASAQATIRAAQAAGFENLSCDLILGLAGQTQETLLTSAARLVGAGVPHISAYLLKIEPGTPFAQRGEAAVSADADTQADLYEALADFLEAAGYRHYEISNFALPGFESRHNLKYWRGADYLGIGPSAHSFLNGRRFYVPSSADAFLRAPVQQEETEEAQVVAHEEYILLGLRLAEGISFARLDALGGNARLLEERARRFLSADLARRTAEGIALTRAGFLLSNTVIGALLVGENY